MTAGVSSPRLDSALPVATFDTSTYPSLLPERSDGRDVLPYHPEVDMLRPKSPQRRARGMQAAPSAGVRTSQPRLPMHSQYPFAGMGPPMMDMGNEYRFVSPQAMAMAMGYGSMGMINPALSIAMGFDPQMAYMMQGINHGQLGSLPWMNQPGLTYGAVGGMSQPGSVGMGGQIYGMMGGMASQGTGGMEMGQQGFNEMEMSQRGYPGMEQYGQGYRQMDGQVQNSMQWQGQWQ